MKTILSFLVSALCLKATAQELHLLQTLNYGKHISDIVLSDKTPFPVLHYVYKLKPAEEIIEDVISDGPMISDEEDTIKKTPYVKPPPIPKYGWSTSTQKTGVSLGAGEYAIYSDPVTMITEDEGDSIFRKFSLRAGKMKCVDSLIFGKKRRGRTDVEKVGNSYCLLHYSELRPGNQIDIYDSTFKKLTSVSTFLSENRLVFADSDRFYVMEWKPQSTSLFVTEYSVKKGKRNYFTVEMYGATSSFGEGIVLVNDTMMLVYAQMYSARDTWVFAMDLKGKTYWRENLRDYADEFTALPGSGKFACSFYNVQQQSTVRFYSLKTGKWEKTLNMQLNIPEFALNTAWPVYLPMRQTALPGGKWICWLVMCYSPSDRNKNSMYLMASNGTSTIKTKLRKSKSISSTNIVPLSKNKMAVVIDDDIYYYAIY